MRRRGKTKVMNKNFDKKFKTNPQYWGENSRLVFDKGLFNAEVKDNLLDAIDCTIYLAKKAPKVAQNGMPIRALLVRRVKSMSDAFKRHQAGEFEVSGEKETTRKEVVRGLKQYFLEYLRDQCGVNFIRLAQSSKSLNKLRNQLKNRFCDLREMGGQTDELLYEIYCLLDDYHRFKHFFKRHILGNPLN